MAIMKVYIMVFFAVAVVATSAMELPRKDYSENHVLDSKPMVLCGKLLERAFDYVCPDSYYKYLSEINDMQAEEPKHETKRRRRSLTEVCCEKPCLLHELQEYCP